MDRLQAMKVFEQVAAENGFAAAARKLGLLPSTVTRLVADLEDHLGVRLLQRSTRRLALTGAGEVYLERLPGILSGIDEAEQAAHSHARDMAGIIRVMSLPGIATHLVAPAIAEFRRQHPNVTINMHCDVPTLRDIEEHDITLVTDQLPLPGTIVVRPVGRSESILCASPDYVRRHGAPRAPRELLQHAYIRLVLPGLPQGNPRLMHEANPNLEEMMDVRPVLTCNDEAAALRSTLEGAGISSQAIQVAAPLLKAGRLQRVLAPWLSERFTVLAGFASRRHIPARTRAFLEHLIAHAAQTQAGMRLRGLGAGACDAPLPGGDAGPMRPPMGREPSALGLLA